MEFVGSDSEGDNNKVDDDNDNEDKIVARSNLQAMAKSNSKTPTTTRTTSPQPVVTREFSSTIFQREEARRNQAKKEVWMRMMTMTIA